MRKMWMIWGVAAVLVLSHAGMAEADAVSAYRDALLNGTWAVDDGAYAEFYDSEPGRDYREALRYGDVPGDRFAVFDADDDGTLEVAVEYEDEEYGDSLGALLSFDRGLSIHPFQPIEALAGVNPEKGWLRFERRRGKDIRTVYSFDSVNGLQELDSWFTGALSDSELREKESRYPGMHAPRFVDLNAGNIDRYLSGSGKPTDQN